MSGSYNVYTQGMGVSLHWKSVDDVVRPMVILQVIGGCLEIRWTKSEAAAWKSGPRTSPNQVGFTYERVHG